MSGQSEFLAQLTIGGLEASTEDLRRVLYSDGGDEAGDLGHFSSYLFQHNARVG